MNNESIVPPEDLSVGQLLKEARLTQSVALEDIAKDLRINKRILEKLEADCDTLVCDVYTLGFIRSYAQLLELNATALIQKFKDQTAQRSPLLSFPTPLPEQGTPNLRILFLSLFVLALVGSFAGYQWWRHHHNIPFRPQNLTVVRPSPPVAPAPPTIQAPQVSHEETTPPSPTTTTLLQAKDETWVEVKDAKGEIFLRRLFYPGETYTFENAKHLVLKTGNAQGVVLQSGDKTLTFPGNKGEIKSDISLNPETWPTDTPESDPE